jgi:hypothetical protein
MGVRIPPILLELLVWEPRKAARSGVSGTCGTGFPLVFCAVSVYNKRGLEKWRLGVCYLSKSDPANPDEPFLVSSANQPK